MKINADELYAELLIVGMQSQISQKLNSLNVHSVVFELLGNNLNIKEMLAQATCGMSITSVMPETISKEDSTWKLSKEERAKQTDELMKLPTHSLGACINWPSGEPKIVMRPDLPNNIFCSTWFHECIHFLKIKNILKRDIPTAAAVGFYERWILERKSPTKMSDYPDIFILKESIWKLDNWSKMRSIVLRTCKEARESSAHGTEIDNALSYYEKYPNEDNQSIYAGALISGIALDLCYRYNHQEDVGFQYLFLLSQGWNHSQAVYEVDRNFA